MYKVSISVTNKFGEFRGISVKMSQEQLDIIKEESKKFYTKSGFELTCEDGSFIVFPPEIVKLSILKILIEEIENEK